MRPVMIEVLTEVIIPPLLLRPACLRHGRVVSAFSVRCIRSCRPFTLRMARNNPLQPYAKSAPMHRQHAQPQQHRSTQTADCCRCGSPSGKPYSPNTSAIADPHRIAPLRHDPNRQQRNRLCASVTVRGSQRSSSCVRNQPLKSMHQVSFASLHRTERLQLRLRTPTPPRRINQPARRSMSSHRARRRPVHRCADAQHRQQLPRSTGVCAAPPAAWIVSSGVVSSNVIGCP